jgi:hypothetical protein
MAKNFLPLKTTISELRTKLSASYLQSFPASCLPTFPAFPVDTYQEILFDVKMLNKMKEHAFALVPIY